MAVRRHSPLPTSEVIDARLFRSLLRAPHTGLVAGRRSEMGVSGRREFSRGEKLSNALPNLQIGRCCFRSNFSSLLSQQSRPKPAVRLLLSAETLSTGGSA